MEAKTIKELLISKNVEYLYHANSVLTSLTYINNGGLMSRSFVDDSGLIQTPQMSDESDKKLDVYNDVFFDSVDLHSRMKDINHYGPVSFVYSVEVLDDICSYDVLITKSNPIHWSDTISHEEKYFTSLLDLKKNFAKGNFGQHITIRHIDEKIGFDKLEKIILDYPGDDKISHFEKAKHEIENALKKNNINIPIEVRNCSNDCKCTKKYKEHNAGYTYHRFKIKK